MHNNTQITSRTCINYCMATHSCDVSFSLLFVGLKNDKPCHTTASYRLHKRSLKTSKNYFGFCLTTNTLNLSLDSLLSMFNKCESRNTLRKLKSFHTKTFWISIRFLRKTGTIKKLLFPCTFSDYGYVFWQIKSNNF